MDNNDYDWDGFTINLYLDEEQEWLAHFVELPNISAFADTPQEALEQLKEAWEGIKECYQAEGKPTPTAPSKKSYSGCFNVRIDKRTHKNLAIEAEQAGLTLNALVGQKLAQSQTTNYAL